MRFEAALPRLRNGEKFRREVWGVEKTHLYIYVDGGLLKWNGGANFGATGHGLLTDDWVSYMEVVK